MANDHSAKQQQASKALAHGTSKSLQKALRLLVHMGNNGPDTGVTELATALGLNAATVHRLLNAMQKFELIEKVPERNRYRLGLRLYDLGTRALESRTLRGEARPFLVDLSQRSNEMSSLASYSSGSLICVDRADPSDAVITVCAPIGERFEPHCTAIGKLVLAYLTEQEVDAMLPAERLVRYTPYTLTRRSDLKIHLRQIAKRGYAVQHQEHDRGVSAVAAPILGADGKVVGAVSVAGPTFRFRGNELSEKIAMTKETAIKISSIVGSCLPALKLM